MDVQKVFHMSGGNGDNSYARNSSLQKNVSDMAKNILIEAVEQVYLQLSPKCMGIADLGCSSGPNALFNVKQIVEAVEAVSCRMKSLVPEFRVYLNDLPGNDFNSVFKLLPDFYGELKKKERNGECPGVYVAGCAASFYGRLFPNNSLQFVYSSYSLHWLSKVPPGLYDDEGKSTNKGNIFISESTPLLVSQAYYTQFKEDFSLFLRLRSEEVTSGGCMVLILLGRIGPDHVDRGNSFYWELLSRSLALLVSQGEIEQEKVDSYDMHFYAPSKEELESEIGRDGCFELVESHLYETKKEYDKSNGSYGSEVAMTVRAIQEPMMCHHFGEDILDNLFDIYARMVDEEVIKQDINPISFAILLRKL